MKFFSPSFLRSCGLAVRVVPARGDALVELLELVGHARPADVVVGVLDRLGVARQQLRVTQQPLDLGGEREGVTRLEERAELALAQQLLVLREPGDHGHRAAGHRAQHELRGGRRSGGGRHGDRRAGEVLRLGAVAGAGQGHALAHAARERRRRRGGRLAQPDRGAPVEVGREAPERAQEQPQGAALLLVREHDLGRTVGLRAARLEVRARADHGVVAGEVALDQVARGREARRAAVEAAEEELHHLARHLRRDEALGGRVEGADVQRARVPQGGRRGARRKRLVHVQEVELGPVEQILERARHVERHRHRAGAPERKRLARRPPRTRSPARPRARPDPSAAP